MSAKDELEKALDPRLHPVQMTREAAESLITTHVYEATALLEQLEAAGLISGNGHHARQKLAQLAALEIRERWTGSNPEN